MAYIRKKRERKPSWHNMPVLEKRELKRQHLIKESLAEYNTASERRDAVAKLRASANVHLGNKLLKPFGFWSEKEEKAISIARTVYL